MIDKLKNIGLTEKEAEIYYTAARIPRSTATTIARESSTNRTVTYNTLQQLVTKGLITYITEDNRRLFSITDPEHLLTEIKEKEEIARDAIAEIQQLSELDVERKVEVYEGTNGLAKINDELREAKQVRIFNATGKVYDHAPYNAKHVVEDMERNDVRIIACDMMRETPLARMKADIKYMPAEYNNYAPIFVFDGQVIVFSFKEKPFIVRIKEKLIYESYCQMFEALWKRI